MFFFVGVTLPDQDMTKAAINTSLRLLVDEATLTTRVRTVSAVAVNLQAPAKP